MHDYQTAFGVLVLLITQIDLELVLFVHHLPNGRGYAVTRDDSSWRVADATKAHWPFQLIIHILVTGNIFYYQLTEYSCQMIANYLLIYYIKREGSWCIFGLELIEQHLSELIALKNT